MQPFPHHYHTSASSTPYSTIALESPGKPSLVTGSPEEFGGTGNEWSPEELLVGAVVDCFILSFKAIAKASRFDWVSLDCDASGTLEKVERAAQFTAFRITARLTVGPDTDVEKAERLLHKSDSICLITNSLKADAELEIKIVTG